MRLGNRVWTASAGRLLLLLSVALPLSSCGLLKKRGDFVDVERDNPPLVSAVRRGDVEGLRRLLEAGAEVDAMNEYGVTALLAAAEEDSFEAMRLLVDAGADVNTARQVKVTTQRMEKQECPEGRFCPLVISTLRPGETPLIVAVSGRPLHADPNVDAMDLLIRAGADIEAVSHALTPLIAASYRKSPEPLKLLLAAGADPNRRVEFISTSFKGLESFPEGSREDIYVNHLVVSPLRRAMRSRRFEHTRLLVDAGADLEARFEHGQTLLMRAAEFDYDGEKVRLLLELGVDVDAVDDSGWTALMYAAYSGSLEAVKHLVAAGADIGLRSTGGSIRDIKRGIGWGRSVESESRSEARKTGGRTAEELARLHEYLITSGEYNEYRAAADYLREVREGRLPD